MKKNYALLLFVLFTLCTSAQDAGVLEIIRPTINTNCGTISDTFRVNFNITYSENSGTIPCYYQLNNDAIVQQDYLWIGITSLNFPQQITPVEGVNTLRVWTDLPGDTDPTNDEVMIQFDYRINNPTPPWSENGESFSEILFPPGNVGCLEFYSFFGGGTPDPMSTWGIVNLDSFLNAPAAASGNKAFAPTSGSGIGSNVYIETPEIDISGLTLAELSFDYHVYGRYQGDVSVDIFYNNAWIENIDRIKNEERQLEITDPWKKKTILLDGYSGVIKIRFDYSDIDWVQWYDFTGPYTNGYFTGIDNIEVKEAPMCPSPQNVSIRFDEITKETANITWNAGHVETDWNIEYGPLGFAPGTGTVVQTSQASYNITGLTAGTDYDVYVQAICGAAPGTNDSALVPSNFQTVCAVVAPWTEDVESHAGTTRGMIENCWKTDAYNTHTYRWNVVNDGGGTPSTGTGPSQPYEGTHFFHIESSVVEGGIPIVIAPAASEMYSPFIDVSSLTTPALKFHYHMYGQYIGSLNVDVFHNGSWTNDVHVISGEQQTSSSDPWGTALVDLSTFSGEIRLRFRGISSSPRTFSSDVALDLIQVNEFQVLSAPQLDSALEIVMYPNPVTDILTIKSQENIDSVTVFTIEGRKVLAMSPTTTGNIKIATAQFETGMYFVEIISQQKKQTLKLLKK
ncbi:MAG: T9SS type A sorting domain-containing protein [Bacteroidota bacterium]